jgi:hypothetical protein
MKPIGSFSAAIDATTVGQDPAPCSSALGREGATKCTRRQFTQ